MSIKDMPHVTVEQVLELRKAAIELEIKLQESKDISARANLRYMEKCKELDLLKQSLPKIKADAVRECAPIPKWGGQPDDIPADFNGYCQAIHDVHESANKLEAGE